MTYTILIVEEQPLFREALCRLLQAVFDAPILIEASSADDGLCLAKDATSVDLVLLDAVRTSVHATESIKAFRSIHQSTSLIVMSAVADERDAQSAFSAGAHAYVSKTISSDALISILHRVLDKGALPCGRIASTSNKKLPRRGPSVLTPRQIEVLGLLSQGYCNKEIGKLLNVEVPTVKMHVSDILSTLGVSNRTKAVVAARDLNLNYSRLRNDEMARPRPAVPAMALCHSF
ncbi:MAG: response regulator transcription factor [Pseudomonadota bacterium]